MYWFQPQMWVFAGAFSDLNDCWISLICQKKSFYLKMSHRGQIVQSPQTQTESTKYLLSFQPFNTNQHKLLLELPPPYLHPPLVPPSLQHSSQLSLFKCVASSPRVLPTSLIQRVVLSIGQEQRSGLGNPLSVCVYVFVWGCEPGASLRKLGFAGEVMVVPP